MMAHLCTGVAVVLSVMLLCKALDDDFRGDSPPPDPEDIGAGHIGGDGEGGSKHPTTVEELLAENGEEDQFPPEETRQRIHRLVVHIDANKDGALSREELVFHLMSNAVRRFNRQLDNDLSKGDTDADGTISFQEYCSTLGVDDSNPPTPEHLEHLKARFDRVDVDGDASLQQDEYGSLLHPEHYPHTRVHLVQSYLSHLDKNGDGRLSFSEYAAVYTPKADAPFPEKRRRTFEDVLDKDKDGALDQEEMEHWIAPDGDSDFAEAEASRLMREIDTDRDGRLSRKEVEEAFDTFLSSSMAHHDEL